MVLTPEPIEGTPERLQVAWAGLAEIMQPGDITYLADGAIRLRVDEVSDGEVVTACQAACPTGSIIFGNINDPSSRVAHLKATPLNYGLLAELNTRPRTTYLAHLRNPNPKLHDGPQMSG